MSLLIKCNQHWFPQSAYEEGVEEIAEPYTQSDREDVMAL